MALDPRTPVIVGVGQVTSRPDPDTDPADRRQPAAMMAVALRRAAEDAGGPDRAGDGTGDGGGGDGGGDGTGGRTSATADRLLRGASSLRVVGTLGWRVPNAPLAVAGQLGIAPGELVQTAVGGNMPVSLLHASARAIAAGRLDVALITGGECLHTRQSARRAGSGRPLAWIEQDDSTPPAGVFGEDREPATELEVARGIRLPIQAYPLLENARRGAAGWTLDEHRARIGRLWASFSEVAAANPHAWMRQPRTAAEITTPAPDNRMVAWPYTKLCTANLGVDQSAAFICCSVAAARHAGVPEERWVFPWSGAEANDHWFLSERPHLHRSPAIRVAGAEALRLAGTGPDGLGPVDLYSCFPAVVQMAAEELGLPLDDPGRPLTLTGGLTFAGGPGNDYSTHGIAVAVQRLRREPGALGLVTGLGWYSTKHAVAVLGARPPTDGGRPGYRWANVQPEVDALPRCPVDPGATGRVTVETYTVLYDRRGEPELGIVACRTPGGARTWANVGDPSALRALTEHEGIGRTGVLDLAGRLALE